MLSLADAPELRIGSDYDPGLHARIAAVRAISPVARGPFGMAIALRYRHLELVTSDATRQIETETKVLQGITSGPIFDFIRSTMLFSNGDAHRRRRGLVARTFAFKLMDAMRPKVASLTELLVRTHADKGPIDFVGEIAAQIPARIIAEILGIPDTDLPIFLRWIEDTAEALGRVQPDRRARVEASLIEFNAYTSDLLADRSATPKDDFLSAYIQAAAGDDLSDLEIRTQVIGLILAGSDTTRGSLCMILAHLLSHPDQWRSFCADPDGLKRAVVEEGLRYDPVVPGIPRIAARDLDIDGFRIPAGTPVAVSILSALRDPDVYADPDTFDIFRTDQVRWHPIFGAGVHRCLGEALARAEMEEALAAIARIAPHTSLIGDFPRLRSGAIRQIDRMEVSFGGGPA